MPQMDLIHKIRNIKAYQIRDSRGGSTVECSISLCGLNPPVGKPDGLRSFVASIPGGISTSKYEAQSSSIEDSIRQINEVIAPELIGKVPSLVHMDEILLDLANKHNLGKQATLPISIAVGRAESFCKNVPYHVLLKNILQIDLTNKTSSKELPSFFFNVVHGGAHGKNGLFFQEILLMPVVKNLKTALNIGLKLQKKVAAILEQNGYATDKTNIPCWPKQKTGKPLPDEYTALDLVMKAITDLRYCPGKDVVLGLDVAAAQFYDPNKKTYLLHKPKTTKNLLKHYHELVKKYPITFIEDPFAPDDHKGWKAITKELPHCQIVGEDLFASNSERIEQGIADKRANGAIIKPGQTAVVSELLKSIQVCRKSSFDIVTSPRSRETNDAFVAELSIACNAKQFKTIACHCKDHMEKNFLLIQKGLNP